MDEAILTFAHVQANRALINDYTVERAVIYADALGIPHHEDRVKDWDNLIGVVLASQGTGHVVDAGVGSGSVFLQGLKALGYSDELHGIGLDVPYPIARSGILYGPGDVRHMPFPDASVGFVMCQSVIEHMRPEHVAEFILEAARVLHRGGRLLISTDYWQDPIDAGTRQAFGECVRIYSEGDLRELFAVAAHAGFTVGGFDFDCQDRVVSWLGLQYTFAAVLMVRA